MLLHQLLSTARAARVSQEQTAFYLPFAIMAYRLQPTRLVEVLLPVLAALYHETEVPAGDESLPGSYLTQIKTMAETRMVRIKAQLFLLDGGATPRREAQTPAHLLYVSEGVFMTNGRR